MPSYTEQTTEKYLRPVLRDLISLCTEKQQATFAKAWGSVESVPFAKEPIAICQCERTIKSNEEKE